MSEENLPPVPGVQWLPAPLWADRTPIFQNDDPVLKRIAAEQELDLLAQVKKCVHEQFSRDPGKQYFTARQMFQWMEAEKPILRLDTEVCEAVTIDHNLCVIHRFIVRFHWDPTSQQAQPIKDTRDESPLTSLTLRRIVTHHLRDVPVVRGVSGEQNRFLEEHWDTILAGLHQAAEDFIEYSSSAGGWAEGSFPERIYMTGEYHIGDVRGDSRSPSFAAMLHFREQPRAALLDPSDQDYVGWDVRFEFDETQGWTFEGMGQMLV